MFDDRKSRRSVIKFNGKCSKLAIIFASALLFLGSQFARAAENRSTFECIVQDASGEPVTGARSMIVDRTNNFIWVSEQQADKITRFNPKTGEWVEFPLPDSESDPRRLEIDPTNPN